MRRYLSFVLGVALIAGCEEGPEQIYKPLPDNFNPEMYNGRTAGGHVETGTQDFTWSTSGKQEDTAKICEGDEQAKRWAKMVKEPIIPTRGAGGIDLRGNPEWTGLTLDDAQQILCQASPWDDGLAYWGDNAEMVVIYDTKTRVIDRLYLLPGYEGTIEAGGYVVALNQQVMKDAAPVIGPTTNQDMLRKLNIAMLKKYRPEVKNPDQRDCVALGTCYVEDWYTSKRFRLLDLMLDFDMEPETERITGLGINLIRDFDFAKNPATFVSSPMPAAGLPPVPLIKTSTGCALTLGVPWSHVTGKCMDIDPEAKALVRPVWSNEALGADMGSMYLYLERPSLAADAVIPDTTTKAAATDVVAAIEFNQFHKGPLSISRNTLFAAYFARVVAAVQALLPSVDMTAKLANLKPYGDGTQLTLGPRRIEDCNETPCEQTTLTKRVRQLVEDEVKAAGLTLPDAIKNEKNFFVEPFMRELIKTFNDDKEPTSSELHTYVTSESAQILVLRLLRQIGGEHYTLFVYYDNLGDQVIYVYFKKGARRAEKALLADAKDMQYDKKQGDGIFRLWNLANSPRIGLGKKMLPSKTMPATQKAVVKVNTMPQVEALVNYLPQSGLSGFGIPIEGKRDKFVPTAYFGFPGTAVGASFYADKNGPIKAVSSSSFYDKLDFCGLKFGLYDKVTDQIPTLPSTCDFILSYSENGKYITGISTYVDSPDPALKMGLRMWVTDGRMDGAYYWAEQGQ